MELMLKKGKYYKKHYGGGRPNEMTDQKLLSIFMEAGLSIEESVKQIKIDKENASTDLELESNLEISIAQQKMEAIQELKPFKDFYHIRNETNNSNIIYYKNGVNTEVVCSLEAFDGKVMKAILEKHDPDFLDSIQKTMGSLITPKDWMNTSAIQALDMCFNSGYARKILIRNVTSDPHPAVVEGCDKFSLTVIPYKEFTTQGITDLNPHLQDFLQRTPHHEYLCAILWSHFIGNLLPYVVYLRGDGGDGKTSFINMLGKLARSYTNFDGGDRFNYFNMFGKSIIGLNENESSHLMQNRVIKSISGGNSVQIEGKGRNSFSGQVRGLIFIDSNYDLELLNREDEKRRLRYFRIQPIQKSKSHVTIAQDIFVETLGSTPMEFLNYCRECYESLHIPGSGGLIKDNPNKEQTFAELIDNVQEHKFLEFYKQNIHKTHILEGKCETIDIILALEKKFPKEPFVQRNFKKFLESKYGIKTHGKYFIGLSKHDKQLEEAMPK